MKAAQEDEYLEFVGAKATALYRSAYALAAGDTHLAEDLVQETFSRVYVLRYWEGHSIEETARMLRLSSSAVRSQGTRALARLRALLGQSNNPSDPHGGYVANGGPVVDDGNGAAFVGVSARRLKLPLKEGDGLSCEGTPARAAGDTCTLSELPSSAAVPGGAVVMAEQNAAERPARAGTARRWTVTVTLKSTGAQLQLVQWNSTGGGSGSDTPKPARTAPPLSEQQVVAALTGAAWAPILGAVG
ncbi:hypothetical protein ADK52_36410 [Streptomyces sp. WM6372]|nr:hypothetical protein ADK52_36410 [Streptomyces sp. WM6372]